MTRSALRSRPANRVHMLPFDPVSSVGDGGRINGGNTPPHTDKVQSTSAKQHSRLLACTNPTDSLRTTDKVISSGYEH